MKKIIFAFIFILFSSFLSASGLIEGKDDSLVFTACDSHSVKSEIKDGTVMNGVIGKYSKDMSMFIQKRFGEDSNVYFYDLVCDRQGDYIVLGVAEEKAFGKGELKKLKSFGGDDIIFVRYDRNLKLKDVQNFGSEGNDEARKIIIDSFDRFIIAGKSSFPEKAYSKAFAARFSEKFVCEKVCEFIGSFSKAEDAAQTEFSSVKECTNGTYILIGKTAKKSKGDFLTKSVLVRIDSKMNICGKTSIGSEKSTVYLMDMEEMADSSVLLVGYCAEETEKGYVAEYTSGFEKKLAYTYMPSHKGSLAQRNYLYSVYKLREDCFMIAGMSDFEQDKSRFYYNFYVPGHLFSPVKLLPDLRGLQYIVCKDTSLYVLGYDKSKLILKQISWKE